MGAGASSTIELSQQSRSASRGTRRFYCNSCGYMFPVSGDYDDPQLGCTLCSSTFVEEINQGNTSFLNRAAFSEEQSWRLANAAVMLRLLETQLLNDLDHMNVSYITRSHVPETPKKNQMTKKMLDKLRPVVAPSENGPALREVGGDSDCPICSETLTSEHSSCSAIQLPCLHLYHKKCILPWLTEKRTCPICRYEITDDPETIQQLERYSDDELKERISSLDENQLTEGKSRFELVAILFDLLTALHRSDVNVPESPPLPPAASGDNDGAGANADSASSLTGTLLFSNPRSGYAIGFGGFEPLGTSSVTFYSTTAPLHNEASRK